jgi:hypothetical protein
MIPEDPAGTRCELCDLAPITRWYARFYVPIPFTILDCDSCDAPMAVLGEHRATVTPEERTRIAEGLHLVARSLGLEDVVLDDAMRQIPDHYHMHARPRPAWWPRP